MIDYGTVRSSVSPDPIVIDDHSVWVHADIRPYTEQTDQGEEKGFEYTMKRYEKDEYIRKGLKTLEDVPEKLREDVQALLTGAD